MSYVKKIHIEGIKTGHIQGIAIDTERKYMYCSFTTCLLKLDMDGNIVGSVKGLAGHLGCIAFNDEDGRVYGSLEYKHDCIGKDLTGGRDVEEGFYAAIFDVEKIDRVDMDAETDGVMTAVYLKEVCDDYLFEGHRYGCSGIDGFTFAPIPGKKDGKKYVYVAYGIYSEVDRTDNDCQIILRYDISDWGKYEKALNQGNMHKFGPEKYDDKYFVYTGNTNFGIQNLEYVKEYDCMLAAVYRGRKPQFSNKCLYAIDLSKESKYENVKGIDEKVKTLPLCLFGAEKAENGISGSDFPYGSTGMISLGDGLFYFSKHFLDKENGHGSDICLFNFDGENFSEI